MSSYNKLNLFCPALILHDICLFFRAPFFDNIIVYKFQFLHVSITGPVSPLSSPPFANAHILKYHESSVHPSLFWNVRINLDAINVKSAMFKTRCCLKIAGGFTSQCIGDYQGAPINQPAYCNQMCVEHRWCESSTWIDVWHILAPCMVNNS